MSLVTSTEAIAPCPPIQVDITNSDGTAFDADIFMFVSNHFTIESHDIYDIDVYDLKVTAKYPGELYTKKDVLPVTVAIEDPCQLGQLVIDPSIITPTPSIPYKIGHEADLQTFS